MILKRQSRIRTIPWGTLLLLAGLSLGIVALLPSPPKQELLTISSPNDAAAWYCGAELVVNELLEDDPDPQAVFVGKDSVRFGNGATQSDLRARSGDFSCRLDSLHNFGMTYTFRDIQALDRFTASVWRYNTSSFQAFLVFNLIGDGEFYKRVEIPREASEDGWERLEATVAIPFDFQQGMLRVYVYGFGSGETFFDDFSLSHERPNDSLAAFSEFPILDLELEEKGLRELDQKRLQAITQGLLIQGEDDWIKGRLHQGDSSLRVKVRLKGDLPDHFRTPKWSFRLQTKSDQAWNRLTTFSLHTPLARDFLSEWFYHEWLRREGVLSPRYDFLTLSLNGQSRGVYAYEEHFEKQLVEYQARREGPILKFDETGVWDVRQRAMNSKLDWGDMERLNESQESAPPQAFKESRLVENPALLAQLEVAHDLLGQFQRKEALASEIFDADLLAKYCAITDLSRAYHGLIWHNLRFYFNPITTRLEPIGFDGFTESGAFEWLDRPFLGARVDAALSGPLPQQQFKQLFLDPTFSRAYYRYLERYTRPDSISQLMLEMEPNLQRREDLIQQEFTDYEFSYSSLPNRAHQIRQVLFPYQESSLKAYLRAEENDSLRLGIFNHHLTALEVVGWGRRASLMSDSLPEAMLVFPAGRQTAQEHALSFPQAAKYVFFRVPGLDTLYHSRILAYAPSGPGLPTQGMFVGSQLKSGKLYELQGKQVLFRPGKHQLSQDLIIPANYEVQIPAGTEIDLIKGAKFVSRSPVHMSGTETDPIRWVSSDKQGQGIVLLQTGAESQWQYVVVDGLNTVSVPGWTLTGSVTCYESPMRFDHCSFLNAPCEDGLNLVRTQFRMSDCTIAYTFSDGFDADFCQGEVRNCFFVKTGNDGMDFSGSEIQVFNTSVSGAGDKGISVGEESQVEVWNLQVENAVTGAAAKDLSRLVIHGITLENCQTGFTAYQKKPEFGGGYLSVEDYVGKGIKRLHLVERGSQVILNGKVVESI